LGLVKSRSPVDDIQKCTMAALLISKKLNGNEIAELYKVNRSSVFKAARFFRGLT
jgi:hypothetical protein